MKIPTTFRNRVISVAGMLCLTMSLALLPAGVNVVRAEDGAETLMSVDPLLAAGDPDVPTTPPVEDEARSVVSPGELPAGVIVLNTRGYNYGPAPAAIDPAAMRREGQRP